ncbi:hypothetical protein QAD02_010667 [Eretmocerus hayati]|uniref:Uncharacterized protein n=1 Tax=Eretmocerus hayati TaxID=131215 RepID=A0ACC2NVR1_9HYME|nr:hypothetical protein QAD02_010667 [Eretmocerus hayati]
MSLSSPSSSSPTTPVDAITTEVSSPNSKIIMDESVMIIEPDTSMAMDSTVVTFDATLPPGAAPEGFVLVDEEVDVKPTKQDSSNICEQPVFRVSFKDESIFQSYSAEVEKFMKNLLGNKFDSVHSKSYSKDLIIEIFTNGQPNNTKSKASTEEPVFDALFTIETEPNMMDDLDIPMYGKKFNVTLDNESEDVEVKADCAPKLTCFNCLGNHNLRDCDQPRNPAAISKNRKEFVAKRGPMNARYHLDDDQKYGNFEPGKLSSNLMEALGLKSDEIPKHVYRMRSLGYPPGWLEEARLQHSGLSLFNSEGVPEVGSDEEGEIVLPGDKDKYDVKKIIDFPGFNVTPPPGIRDEYQQYWGSPMQEHHSKATMLQLLSHKKADDGYKRRKLTNPANKRIKLDVNPGEMEIDEVEDAPIENVPVEGLFIPPLPQDSSAPPPPPPPEPGNSDENSQDNSMNSNDASTTPSSRDGSPSLFDLECVKKKLHSQLQELEGSGSRSKPAVANTGSPKTENSDETKNSSPPELKESSPSLSNATSTNNTGPDVTPQDSPMSGTSRPPRNVVEVILGTPILKSCSPYKKLPASEKFSKDICDVINFENLPDSTGKYDKMAELLVKVRTTVTKLQKE